VDFQKVKILLPQGVRFGHPPSRKLPVHARDTLRVPLVAFGCAVLFLASQPRAEELFFFATGHFAGEALVFLDKSLECSKCFLPVRALPLPFVPAGDKETQQGDALL
jgi:hypothetical protein